MRAEGLDFALARDYGAPPAGIWGGHSGLDRVPLRRRLDAQPAA